MIMHVIASFLIFIYCSVFISAYNCSENCAVPESYNTSSCDILTGTCSFGCKQGFAGDNCLFVCPEKCGNPDGFNTETCNISTSACLHGCQYGFTGSHCSIQCPENCTGPPDSNNNVVCDETSRECLFGCKSGYYGPNCTQLCNNSCDSCNQENSTSDVICTECIMNFYLDNNVCKQCSYWCSSVPVHVSASPQACNKYDGTCIYGCKTGRYGRFCEKYCIGTCKNNVCDPNSGICLNGCNPSSYCGATCQAPCSDACLQRTCHQNCTCTLGCQSNSWGERCERDCSANCQKLTDTENNICDRTDGTCTHGCVNNTLWGGQCSSACSKNCFNGTCERWSGNCLDGCINNDMYGRFGTSCEFRCQETCVNRACHAMSGVCTYGCIDGYSGETCDKVSPVSPVSRAEIGTAVGEGVLFLMLVIIYLVKKSDQCAGLRNKVSCGSDTLEKVLQRNTDPNPYTELNHTNDAEATAKPYDAFDLHTTANIEEPLSNPAQTQTAVMIL